MAINRLAGACRYVWNWSLARQNAEWQGHLFAGNPKPPSPTFFTLGKAFTELRNSKGQEWLTELPFKEVRHTLKHQADAWQAFLKGQRGKPRFKGRGAASGFTIPEKVRIRNGCIALPRIGEVRLRRRGGSPYPDGVPKQAVFKRECGKWYCTVFYAVDIAARVDDGTAVGIDRNVGQCATSDGKIIRLPDLSRLDARLRRYQRRMARQQKGSNRRRRTKAKLACTGRKIANVRATWSHKVSRNLADRHHTVVVEDLNTAGMTRSAKGTAANPGSNVRQKAGLNRSVLASAWQGLERNLAYKAGRVVRVKPAYTSQTCHSCGMTDATSRINQSTFRCQACGHEANADVNAALNILASGTGASGRGGGGAARPGKRQIAGLWLAA